MYINLDGLEIMVRVRREELMRQAAQQSMAKRRPRAQWVHRGLVRLGGLRVTAGMALEKLGLDREVYHLSTTTSS